MHAVLCITRSDDDDHMIQQTYNGVSVPGADLLVALMLPAAVGVVAAIARVVVAIAASMYVLPCI